MSMRLFGNLRAAAVGLGFVPLLLAGPAPAAPADAPSGQFGHPASADALRAAATDDATRQFYERYGWQAVWTPANRLALDRILGERASHGLDRISFLNDGASSASAAEQEVAPTGAALRYADALARGAADPAGLHQIYTLPRPQVDVAGGLAMALADNRLEQWFAGLAPQDEEYARLSEAYRAEAKDARSGEEAGSRIAAGGLIRVGDTDDRLPDIVDTLKGEGYLDDQVDDGGWPQAGPSPASLYTQRIADAVKRLQQDYGIAKDGVIGPDTLKVLNRGPGDRARALAVALERRRWLARNPPATRIDVNTAAARLRYYRDGKLVDSRKVIVGKPGKETPLLLAPIYRLVANPTWTVPKSIERTELANVGPSYLAEHNMVRRNGYIVQQPGPHNALGLVKFDMLDDYAIYLHDTGSPSLFERTQRHLSHGCVRVDDALGFARMIAQDQGIAGEWQEAQAGREPQFVDLPQKLPVRLLYRNVFVDDRGQIAFRTDPYGWNAPVAKALGFGSDSSRPARAEPIDVGP
jgi:murein L,D-transpeptidase YcbB/YkuD